MGVIGCGRAAMQLHLPALARLAELEVTALADADAARLAAAGTKWGVDRRYADYRALLHDPSVNTVLITVPTPFHCAAFLAAVDSGKHIYIEKPLAMTLEEADRMLTAAAQFSGSTVVGFNLRSHRVVRRVRDLIRSGVLGPVVSLRTVWVGGPQDRPAWQRRRAEGGGAIYELGIHHFDLWRFLLDTEVVHVEAQSLSNDSDDAKVAVTARLRNGVLASSVFALHGAAAHEVEVIGESASLRFSLYGADSLEIRPAGRLRQFTRWLQQLPAAVRATRRGGDYPDSYRTHWLRFLESVPGGEPPATLQDGREAVRIALAAIGSFSSTCPGSAPSMIP